MLTLSNGYKKPQNGIDTSDVWFPAMETNVQLLNDHTHSPGVDGNQLFVKTQAISSGSWAAAPIGGGLYIQTITLPTGYAYDTTDMWFRLSTGEIFLPSIERVSGTQYKIYINDNSLAVTAFYR